MSTILFDFNFFKYSPDPESIINISGVNTTNGAVVSFPGTVTYTLIIANKDGIVIEIPLFFGETDTNQNYTKLIFKYVPHPNHLNGGIYYFTLIYKIGIIILTIAECTFYLGSASVNQNNIPLGNELTITLSNGDFWDHTFSYYLYLSNTATANQYTIQSNPILSTETNKMVTKLLLPDVDIIQDTYSVNILNSVEYIPSDLSVKFYSGISFEISIQPPCILENTFIKTGNSKLCFEGDYEKYDGEYFNKNNYGYEKVQDLQEGQLIWTTEGYLAIKKIKKSNVRHWCENPNKLCKLYRHKNANLVLTGGHSVLKSELGQIEKENILKYIPPEKLMVSSTYYRLLCFLDSDFVLYETDGYYDVYSIVLENHGNKDHKAGIVAQGVLVESTDERHCN